MSLMKLFSIKENRDELISLIKKGWQNTELSRYFQCGIQTIRNQRDSLIATKTILVSEIPKRRITKEEYRVVKNKPVVDILLGEKLNPGKQSDKDYVKAEQERKGRSIHRYL